MSNLFSDVVVGWVFTLFLGKGLVSCVAHRIRFWALTCVVQLSILTYKCSELCITLFGKSNNHTIFREVKRSYNLPGLCTLALALARLTPRMHAWAVPPETHH